MHLFTSELLLHNQATGTSLNYANHWKASGMETHAINSCNISEYKF